MTDALLAAGPATLDELWRHVVIHGTQSPSSQTAYFIASGCCLLLGPKCNATATNHLKGFGHIHFNTKAAHLCPNVATHQCCVA
jgi:hypothetical protein